MSETGAPTRTTTRGRAPAAARQRRLFRRIAHEGFLSVATVAAEFGVSEMTIRRDLRALESEGMIERSHGGAVQAADVGDRFGEREERPFATRAAEYSEAKERIACASLDLVNANESVGLDVGTTVCQLARELVVVRGLNIITSSLRALTALAEVGASQCTVHLLGGRARLEEGALCGPTTIAQLAEYSLDTVFIGAAGVTADGVYDFSVEDSEVKKAFIRRASRVVLLCDASKFGRRSLCRFASLDRLSTLVTERAPDGDLARALDRHGVAIRIAP